LPVGALFDGGATASITLLAMLSGHRGLNVRAHGPGFCRGEPSHLLIRLTESFGVIAANELDVWVLIQIVSALDLRLKTVKVLIHGGCILTIKFNARTGPRVTLGSRNRFTIEISRNELALFVVSLLISHDIEVDTQWHENTILLVAADRRLRSARSREYFAYGVNKDVLFERTASFGEVWVRDRRETRRQLLVIALLLATTSGFLLVHMVHGDESA